MDKGELRKHVAQSVSLAEYDLHILPSIYSTFR